VNPNEVGIGIYPLVLVKEGKEGFDMEAFLSLENLQKPRALYGDYGDYDKQLVIRTDAFLNYTGKVMDLTFNGWFTKSVFIDELNYKCVVNSTYGIELYAIRDVNCLTEDYKDIYKKNGVYCKVTKDQSTVAQGYALNVSFEVLEYIPLAESYIPNHVPKVKTAKVGQTIVVKEVNVSGVITEWEAVDLPEGEALSLVVKVLHNEVDADPTVELIKGDYESAKKAIEEDKIVNGYFLHINPLNSGSINRYVIPTSVLLSGERLFLQDDQYDYDITPDGVVLN
jgi:hypothetical protein